MIKERWKNLMRVLGGPRRSGGEVMSEAQMRRISYLRSIVKDRDAEIERLRAALRAAFDAGSELGWDHATYGERGGPEPIGHEDAFAAFLAALDGQPAPGEANA